jgi:phosphoribosylcarboxyaminoimidazole (NCAIR) mutase
MMPSDTPVMTVVDPGNAALAAIRILALGDAGLREALAERILDIKKSFDN